MMTVKSVIERKGAAVASIDADAPALRAAQAMNERSIGSLVVVDAERVIGIVTERDILRRIVAAERDPARTPVREIMTAPVACCRLETTLEECRTVMTARRIRRLPVVEQGELKGIITSGDILAQDLSDHQSTIMVLNEYLYASAAPRGIEAP
jgi:CBS domain-containing protein